MRLEIVVRDFDNPLLPEAEIVKVDVEQKTVFIKDMHLTHGVYLYDLHRNDYGGESKSEIAMLTDWKIAPAE